jgi:IclR family transcriptional regulator, acetate operon repressor
MSSRPGPKQVRADSGPARKSAAVARALTRGKSEPDPLTAPGTPVERLFAVLELAAKMGLISAADAVYMLDLPRPTAHRMISTLEGLGFLQKMPVKGKYAVAPKLVSLASSVLGSTIVYAPLQTLLTTIAQRTGETCGIALMSMGEVEYIASVKGQSPLTLQFQAGQKAPLHCTSSGQVFLAGLEPEALNKFLATGPWDPMTASTVTEPKALAERLRKVRAQGFACNESEYIQGVVGAAVPITNRDGQVTAALTISAPKSRRTLADITAMVPTLKTFADRISRIL